MKIKLRDDGGYGTQGIIIVTFKRESNSHLHMTNVMYVPRLRKNSIYVAILEDRGYDVVFSKGKSFQKYVATKKVKHVGVKVKNIYKLEVELTMHASIPIGVRYGDVDICNKGAEIG